VNMEDILAKLQSITQLAVRDPTKAPNALFDLATELLGKDAMDALVKVALTTLKSTIKSKMEEAGLGECTDVVDQVMARLSDPASASSK